MRERELRQLYSVEHVWGVITSHPDRYPEIRPLSGKLGTHVERIQALYVSEQMTKRRPKDDKGPAMRRLAAEIRRKHLIPIGRAAKRIFRFVPGKEHAVVVPPARATPADVVKAARSTLKAVRGAVKLFVEIGFAPNFMQECSARTDQLEKLVTSHQNHRSEHPGIVKALRSEVNAARDIIEVMDGLLGAAGYDSVELMPWRLAKRVGKRIGRPPKPRKRRAVPSGAEAA